MSDSILNKLGTFMGTADAALAHAAGWLMSKLDAIDTEVASIEASSPLVAQALTAAKAYAVAHGVPVAALDGAESALVALVTKVAASTTPAAPAPAAPVADPAPPAAS